MTTQQQIAKIMTATLKWSPYIQRCHLHAVAKDGWTPKDTLKELQKIAAIYKEMGR